MSSHVPAVANRTPHNAANRTCRMAHLPTNSKLVKVPNECNDNLVASEIGVGIRVDGASVVGEELREELVAELRLTIDELEHSV